MSFFSSPPAPVQNFAPLRLMGRWEAVIMTAPSKSNPAAPQLFFSTQHRPCPAGGHTHPSVTKHRQQQPAQCPVFPLPPARPLAPSRMQLMNMAGVVHRLRLATAAPRLAMPAIMLALIMGEDSRGSRPTCDSTGGQCGG